MSPRRTLTYVLATAAIACAVACGGKSKSSSSSDGVSITSASSSSSASSQPAAAGKTASDNDLQAFANALAKVKSFKASISSSGGAVSQDGTIEVSVPDKFHITSGQLELISIGSDTYVKTAGTWLKAPSSAPASAIFQPNQLSGLATAAQAGQVTKGGTDAVNGKKCQIYTTTSGGQSQEICVADNLPLRIVTTTGSSKTTIVFTDFDKPVDIKAPI